jgi:hypothetical protein
MGSIFKPKMPALPPVQPLPEPPSAVDCRQSKKQESKRNKLRLKEEEKVESLLFLLDHLVLQESEEDKT